MKQLLYYAVLFLATMTIPCFVVTLTLFARGNWHLGKRILATTAVLGFLMAVVFWLTVLIR